MGPHGTGCTCRDPGGSGRATAAQRTSRPAHGAEFPRRPGRGACAQTPGPEIDHPRSRLVDLSSPVHLLLARWSRSERPRERRRAGVSPRPPKIRRDGFTVFTLTRHGPLPAESGHPSAESTPNCSFSAQPHPRSSLKPHDRPASHSRGDPRAGEGELGGGPLPHWPS